MSDNLRSLDCGCILVGQARSFSQCRENHGPGTGNVLPRPAPGKAPPVVSDARREQKNAEARESGRKLKPGRHRLDLESGTVVPDARQDAQEPAGGPSGPAPGNLSQEVKS
jgi:hypothetical protein